MVAIKITYGSSVHKFNVAADSTWATFEYNLRTLFKIPDNYKVIASYTDEDNDVITLSSDIELREVLYHHSNDTGTPVRLVLNAIPTTNNSNNNKEIQETFEKMSIADDEKCCATETETETEREHVCDETCEKSSDEKCCNNKSSDEKCCEDEEEDTEQSSSDPEVYYFVRSKRGPRFGSAKFDSFKNSSGRCPFKRGEFVPPPHHRQPRGGPFGPFGPFNHHGGPSHHHRGPGPRGFHGHPPSHPPPEYTEIHRKHHGEFEEFGPHGSEFSHFGPFGHGPYGHGSFGHGGHGGHGSFGHGGHGGHGRFHGHGGHGPRNNREKECCKEGKENRKDDKECNKGEKCEKDTTDPRVEHGPHVPPGPPGSHGPHGPHSLPAFRGPHGPHGNPRMRGHRHGHHPSFRGHEHGHGHGFRHHHNHRPRHNNGGPHCHRHHKPLTPEELAEKVALLNSMNFPSDKNEHYEELLKKFHGRIGRVVEILLCERKHKDDEDHKEPDGDDNSDDDSNNDDPGNEFEEIKESETSPFLV